MILWLTLREKTWLLTLGWLLVLLGFLTHWYCGSWMLLLERDG